MASVANATQVSGSNSTVVASQITARDDLTIASVNPGVGSTSQVQLVGSSLNAVSQVRLISSGNVVLTDAVSPVVHIARSTLFLSKVSQTD